MTTFIMNHEIARRRAMAEVANAPAGYIVKVEPARRSLEANAKLHAMLSDISAQVEWVGAHQDIDTWKRLLTAAWMRTRGDSVRFLPAVDGQGVDIVFQRTSTLTKAEMADLIEYVTAWAVSRDVALQVATA